MVSHRSYSSMLRNLSTAIHKLFHKVWTTGRVPIVLKEGVIWSLYKGEGTWNQCSSYQLISLLLVPRKVFAHVLLISLEPLLMKTRRSQPSGFTRGRSTMNAILALRLLSEPHWEFRRPLNVAYINIKAAVDSVDRNTVGKPCAALVSILSAEAHRGLPHWNHILCKTRRSSIWQFPHNIRCPSRVRIGPCSLLPCHRLAPQPLHRQSGIKRRKWKFHGPQLKLSCSKRAQEAGQTSLQKFKDETGTRRLHISWIKTKIQNVGSGSASIPITIIDQTVDIIDKFTYLGSDIDSSSYCSPDIWWRLDLVSYTMGQLDRVWRNKRPSTLTKLRIYSISTAGASNLSGLIVLNAVLVVVS